MAAFDPLHGTAVVWGTGSNLGSIPWGTDPRWTDSTIDWLCERLARAGMQRMWNE